MSDPRTTATPLTPTPPLLLVLAGMTRHTEDHHATLPALAELPDGWTGYAAEDLATLETLHAHRLLTISDDTPPDACPPDDTGHLTPRLRRARFLPTAGDALTRLLAGGTTARLREETAQLVTDMETRALLRYTDALLVTTHGHPPLPDDLRPVLAGHIHHGIHTAGYTPGQLTCLAWRAVTSAATWTEAVPLTDPADATCTLFRSKLDRAHTTRAPLPEYPIPRWAAPPASLHAGRTLIALLDAHRPGPQP